MTGPEQCIFDAMNACGNDDANQNSGSPGRLRGTESLRERYRFRICWRGGRKQGTPGIPKRRSALCG